MKPAFKTLTLICLLFCSLQVFCEDKRIIRYGITHQPPVMIIADKSYTGISVETLQFIAEKLAWQIEYVHCPRKRCFRLMELGLIDIMTGVIKSTEREEYLYFVEPPIIFESPIVFYFPKGRGIRLKNYADLSKLNIGTVIGHKYYGLFDSDHSLNKTMVNSNIQNIKMLLAGRIDTFIGGELDINMLLAKMGNRDKLEISTYRIDTPLDLYYALSKKSSFIKDSDNIYSAQREYIDSGEAEELMNKHLGLKPKISY
ncbi:MAG: transporter substrate-binding domain-containing protein [Pseudomonadales bacterium]|nr:transporter substrate-binding domain-containing protein [Pseudomonadales bacterium]